VEEIKPTTSLAPNEWLHVVSTEEGGLSRLYRFPIRWPS
jgi:hypothetical protein